MACGQDNAVSNGSDRQQPVPQQSDGYDEMSEEYNAVDARVIWQRPELVVQALGNLENKVVADIGAGTGFFAFRIAAAGADVLAIDVDPRAISFMDSEKERYPDEVSSRFNTRLATEDDSALENEEADIVLMVNTYIYIENRVEYFSKLQDGMKRGGKLIIVDFKKKRTTIGPNIDDRLTLQEVQKELSDAGYTITGVDEDSLDYQYLIEAVKQ